MLTILDLTAKILFVLLFFGLCIFIHELGHLLVGLWRGLYVEVFSIGFGKKLWGFTYRGVDYIVSALPLGGYVKLPQLDPTEIPMTSDDKPLPPTAPGNRALTALAGPVANVIFGFFLALFITWFGVYVPKPSRSVDVIGVPRVLPLPKDGLELGDDIVSIDGKAVPEEASWWDSIGSLSSADKAVALTIKRGEKTLEIDYTPAPNPEYQAGLRAGDVIVAADGKGFEEGWGELVERILLNTDELELSILRDGREQTITYLPSSNPFYEGLGYPFFEIREDVAAKHVHIGSAAERAGIKARDILRRINGKRVLNSTFFATMVRESGGKPLTITVERDGHELVFEDVRPRQRSVDGEKIYLVGIEMGAPVVLAHPSPWRQFTSVIGKTVGTLKSLFAPVMGRRSLVRVGHMTSVLGIVPMMLTKLVTEGYRGGLAFVIVITFSLAFMNLLPLPVLDGGHIVYAIFEIATGRRVPKRLVLWLQNIFAVLLISMLVYISFFDVRRLPKYFQLLFDRETAPAIQFDDQDEDSAVEPEQAAPLPKPPPSPPVGAPADSE